jgi:hypothetical protein
MKKITIVAAMLLSASMFAQQNPTGPAINPNAPVPQLAGHAWYRGGNNLGGNAGNKNIFGTMWNSPIHIFTSGTHRATWTTNNSLNSWNGNSGDGLRILNQSPFPSAGNLDLFTSFNAGTNETHIRFGNNGQVSGQNNRFEFISTGGALGNYYSTFSPNGIHRFDRGETELGRLGTNNHWRFGQNTSGPITGGLNAARMMEVVDNTIQFRLTFSPNATGPFTDFFSNNLGNLQILPSGGNVGINLNANPTHTIDVNGNARIRNTPIAAIPQSLIIGQQVGVANDRELQRLDFTGNANDVLLGNGTWGTVQTNLTANNGISINTANQIQLGVPCTVNGFPNIGGVLATQFTESRVIANRNHNLWIISANGETGGVGIGGQPSTSGFCNTGNTLEISANSKNTKYGSANASGLRLSKLTSASPTIANTINGVNNTKVLTVDSDGDVVLTDAIGSFGSICGSATPSQLTGNSEIQLTNFDFHFTGNGGTMQQNNVGIGTNCLNPLAGKLHVLQATTDAGTTGAYVLNTDDTSPPTNNSSLGMYVHNSGTTIDLATCRTVAAWFETDLNVDGSQNIAISVPQSGGVVSIGFNAANNAAGNIEPDVCAVFNTGEILEVNGSVYASTGFVGPSDAKFKTNILPITNALNKVKSLNGVYYDYQTANFPNMNFSTNRQVGLIAQNVDTVLTEVVTYDSLLDAYTMDYSKINALLIEAIKEQQNQIDSMNVLVATQDSINADLEGRLATLEACINNIGICNNNGGGNGNGNKVSSQSVTLENLKAIVLDQNLPNPFAESTQINFVIPDDVLNAKLLFYDMSGRIINEVNINERGNGTLTVYGENLEKGIYTYSLIADGKLIATKKMVKK